jgi:cytochrome P450
VLWVNDLKVINDLYVTKNKYFDKHPLVQNLLKPLVGETILFVSSNEEWAKKRKSLSATFYKDKLQKMTDIAKRVVSTAVERWYS